MADTVLYREPRAFVQFVGTTLQPVAPDQIIAVKTRKALHEPAGTFEVTLKTGTDAPARRFAGHANGGPSGPSSEHWMEQIRPMTVCVIAFGTDNELFSVSQAIAARTASGPVDAVDSPAVKKAVVMVGVVDSVTVSTMMGMSGPMRSVVVSGRDIARILLDDVLRRVTVDDQIGRSRFLVPVGQNITSADPVGRVLIERMALFGPRDPWYSTTIVNGSKHPLSMRDFCENILLYAPSFNLRLQNNQTISDYLTTAVNGTRRGNVDLHPMLESYNIVSTALSRFQLYNGPPWQPLQDMAPKPMTECFMDTVGLSARLVVRRPPFGRPKAMQGFEGVARAMADASMSQPGIDPASGDLLLEELLRPSIAGVPSEDEFVTTPSRVHSEPYHTVPMSEVLHLMAARSASDMFSLYQAQDVISMTAQMSSAYTAPVLYDLPAGAHYGTQVMTVTVPWGLERPNGPWVDRPTYPLPVVEVAAPTSPSPSLGEYLANTVGTGQQVSNPLADVLASGNRLMSGAAGMSTSSTSVDPAMLSYNESANRLITILETVRMFYYFRDNAEFLSGGMAIRGRPEIRIGDRVYLPGYGDTIFYVNQVEHAYQFGKPFVTQLAVSRGQPFHLTGRLAPTSYDRDSPLKSREPMVVASDTVGS